MRFFVCKGMNNLRKNSSIVWILCKKGENAGGNRMVISFRPLYYILIYSLTINIGSSDKCVVVYDYLS